MGLWAYEKCSPVVLSELSPETYTRNMTLLPLLVSLTVLAGANPVRTRPLRTINTSGLSKEVLDHIYDHIDQDRKNSDSQYFRPIPDVGPASEAPVMTYPRATPYMSPGGKLPVPTPGSSSYSFSSWLKSTFSGGSSTSHDPNI